jgi:endonuclease/exonuclease/phosphatase (EEP) superfamily protein YafD
VTARRSPARALDGLALAFVAFAVLRPVHRGWLPPVTLANQLLPFVLAAALPLAVIAALARRRLAALVFACAGLAFAVLFVPRLFDRELERLPQPPGARVRVLTFNVANDVSDPRELVAFLRASGADVIALQELSQPDADAIEAGLSDVYPHQVLYGLGVSGSGVLSRTPIRSHEFLPLTPARPFPRSVIELAGTELTLIGVHAQAWVGPCGSWVTDARNFPELARLAARNAPALIVGDFNTTEHTHAYRAFPRAGLTDAYRTANTGFGFTFPIDGRYRGLPGFPIARIDHIWHTPDFVTVRAWVGADAGSDHYPLLADLVLTSAAAE